MSTARYRILSPGGEKLQDGEAEVEVRDGLLLLAPAGESVLPIPFGHIVSVTEPEPFTVRLTLAGGDVIEFGRLGVMRTQLLAELRDGRGTPRRRPRPRWARPRASRRSSPGARAKCGSTTTRCWSSGPAAASGSASPSPGRCGYGTTRSRSR